MQAYIKNKRTGHGLQFILGLQASKGIDEESFKKQLKEYIGEEENSRSVLYVCGIEYTTFGVELELSDGARRMAGVDHLWNYSREDLKFPVVVIDDDKNYTDGHSSSDRFQCHLCKNETWGVERIRMEVYGPGTDSVVSVNVHGECKKQFLKKISTAS